MDSWLEKAVVYGACIFLGLLLLLMLWGLLVELPMAVYTDAKCTDLGYPDSTVVWFLRPHCIGWYEATKFIVPLEQAPVYQYDTPPWFVR